MKKKEDISAYTSMRCYISIGAFDGLHRGHRQIITRLTEEARTSGGISGIVLMKKAAENVPQELLPIDKRRQMLESLGVDFVLVNENRDFETLAKGLLTKFASVTFVVGSDFELGQYFTPSVSTLKQWSKKLGFDVEEIDIVREAGESLSTEMVKSLVRDAQFERYKDATSRPFSICANIVKGRGVGRKLGFATANLNVDFDTQMMPSDGIYACVVELEDTSFPCAVYLGNVPTFNVGFRVCEVCVLDFEGDIYGEDMALTFVKKIRDDKKFVTPEELQQQIKEDIKQVRQFFLKRGLKK